MSSFEKGIKGLVKKVMSENTDVENESDGSIKAVIPYLHRELAWAKLEQLKKQTSALGVQLTYDIDCDNPGSPPRDWDWERDWYARFNCRVKIKLDTPVYQDKGFILAATIETTSAGNLVYPQNGFEGEGFVERFGDGQFKCDECKTKRARNFYHVFREVETGEDFIYGNDCAQRKFGVDFLKKLEKAIEIMKRGYSDIFGAYTEDGERIISRGPKGEYTTSTFSILLSYYALFRTYQKGGAVLNYISEKENTEKINPAYRPIRRTFKGRYGGTELESESSYESRLREWERNVSKILSFFGISEEGNFGNAYTQLVRQKLEDFIRFFNEFTPKEGSEFERNLKIIALDSDNKGYIKQGKIKLFAYAVWLWFNRTMMASARAEEERRTEVPTDIQTTNEYYGAIGDQLSRLMVKCTNKSDTAQRGQYGDYYRYNLISPDGYKFTFFGNTGDLMERGRDYAINATVSKHQEFGGNKVTVLSRVQVAGEEVRAEPGQEAPQPTVSRSEFVGEIKQRLRKLPVTVTMVRGPITSSDGMSTYMQYGFDNEGNKIVAFATNPLGIQQNERLEITATVKAHKEYKGEKTTQVNRVVVDRRLEESNSKGLSQIRKVPLGEAVIFNFDQGGRQFLEDLEGYFSSENSISLDELADMGSRHGIEVVDYDTFYDELPELWRKGQIPPRGARIFGLANPNTRRARLVFGSGRIGREMIPMIRTIVSHELVHVGQSERMAPGQIYIPPRTVFDKKVYYSDFREIMAWSRTIADEVMDKGPETFEEAVGLLTKSGYYVQIKRAVGDDPRVWNKYLKNIYNYIRMEFDKREEGPQASRIRNEIRRLVREAMDRMPTLSSSDSRQNLRNWVSERIDFDGYGEFEGTPKSRNLETAIDVFMGEYGWAVKQMGQKRAFIEWLQGLPSVLDIPYHYYEIKNLMYALGYDEVGEMEDQDIAKLYYEELYEAFFG